MIHKPQTRTSLLIGATALITAAGSLLAGSAGKAVTSAAPSADTGWQVIGKGNYNYNEVEDFTTGNALRLSLQLNRDITSRFYVGIVNSFTYDEIAALDYRYQIAAVLGYRVWTTDRSELTLEAGPGYTWERQAGLSDDYFTIRFAERFKYTISENSRFIQSLEYQPSASDFGRYTLVADAAITARIMGNLWWRTGVRDIYNSQPPFGLDQNDLQLTTGLSWGLGDPEAKAAPAKKIRKKSDVTKPAAAPSRPEGVWKSSAAIGFSLAKGNSDNMLLSGDIATSMVSKPHEYALSLGGSYGEVNTARTVQNLHAGAQYNRLLTDRVYLGAALNFLTDDVADLDYRITPGLLLGYKVIDTDTVSLRLEAGPGYTWEKQGGVSNDYFTLIARERLEVALSDRAKAWQSVTAQFDVSDSKNYLLTSEVGVDFWLTESISVRTVASDIYDNQPAPGTKANDLRVTSGIAIAF
jgi:putative salt-induced outer membrane protein